MNRNEKMKEQNKSKMIRIRGAKEHNLKKY